MIEELHKYNIDVKSRQIWIHGVHTESEYEPGIDWRSATITIKNLNILKKTEDPVTIHLHTCGGDVCEGMAIYDTIKAMPYHVTIIGYAEVRSMSSIIFLAGDERILMPNALYMIHKGIFGIEAEANTVYSNVKESQKFDRKMIKMYSDVSDYSEKQIENMMDKRGDVFFTAEEAVEHGFADGIYK